jgi:hypothetical protein
MLAINQKISEILMNFWGHLKSLVDPFLGNLDPSLFQNIILGILAIFIPFAIVFYTNILDSKKKRSEFEKMVLSDEVLGTKTIFWFSIFSIIFFSFFSGTDISINAKISAIIFLAISISILWKPFKKILIFSEGKKTEFEISFLKKFKLSRILTFSNNVKLEKIIRAWESFWSEKSGFNEGTFTKIFISHIDETIKHGKLNFTVQLAKTYNIHQRDTYLVGYEILPKILEWNERLWNKQQLWLEGRGIEKRIQKLLPEKQVPTFQKLALRIFKRIYEIEESFGIGITLSKIFLEKL